MVLELVSFSLIYNTRCVCVCLTTGGNGDLPLIPFPSLFPSTVVLLAAIERFGAKCLHYLLLGRGGGRIEGNKSGNHTLSVASHKLTTDRQTGSFELMPKAKVLLQLTGWRLLEQNCLVVVEVVKRSPGSS